LFDQRESSKRDFSVAAISQFGVAVARCKKEEAIVIGEVVASLPYPP
jgi:hypothetical protein